MAMPYIIPMQLELLKSLFKWNSVAAEFSELNMGFFDWAGKGGIVFLFETNIYKFQFST